MKKIAIAFCLLLTVGIVHASSASIRVVDPGDTKGLIKINENGQAVDVKNKNSYPTIFDFSAKYPYYIKACYTGYYSEMQELVNALVENARKHPAVIRVRLLGMDRLRNGDIIVELESKGLDLNWENEILIKICN